jgi:hypothetical protein
MDDVVLARHGESETAAVGILGGDAPLTHAGRRQACALGETIRGYAAEICLTSGARRARETATLALAGREVPLEIVPELADIDFGRFEGRSLEEYRDWVATAGTTRALVRGSRLVIVELGAAPDEAVGGKAAGLARLVRLGLPVPPALVLPVGVELGDAEEVVRRLGEPLAVRSSAVDEDRSDRSAAGQFETVLDVDAAGLAEAVRRVRASARGERAQSYGAGAAMAVVIQRQVRATRAGIAFTRDPVSGADEVVVECAFGRGDAVVSGEVTPDRYRLANGSVLARAAGVLRTLRDDEVLVIADLLGRAEAGFGAPVDVEFCFDGRTLWLVQCRAITTL